jgi:hypothetical protein
VLLAVTDETWLLAAASFLTAVGGIVATVLAHRAASKEAKRKADDACFDRLRDSRAEAERLADELHRLKMDRLS